VGKVFAQEEKTQVLKTARKERLRNESMLQSSYQESEAEFFEQY